MNYCCYIRVGATQSLLCNLEFKIVDAILGMKISSTLCSLFLPYATFQAYRYLPCCYFHGKCSVALQSLALPIQTVKAETLTETKYPYFYPCVKRKKISTHIYFSQDMPVSRFPSFFLPKTLQT